MDFEAISHCDVMLNASSWAMRESWEARHSAYVGIWGVYRRSGSSSSEQVHRKYVSDVTEAEYMSENRQFQMSLSTEGVGQGMARWLIQWKAPDDKPDDSSDSSDTIVLVSNVMGYNRSTVG